MTIELKDLVKIDKRFENSVNLYLDLDNREKIDNYVYTRSSQRIIDYYIDNVNKTINQGKQDKHIIGSNNYIDGKSYLTISKKKAQELINQYAGKGQ